ncbi:MAG: hypothetical protein AB1899_10265 [Pseudomonadota bacterium]
MRTFAQFAIFLLVSSQTSIVFGEIHKCKSPTGATIYQDSPCEKSTSKEIMPMQDIKIITSNQPQNDIAASPVLPRQYQKTQKLKAEPPPWHIDYQCAQQRETNTLTPECKRKLDIRDAAIMEREQQQKNCQAALNALTAKCGITPRHNNPQCINENGHEAMTLCKGL